MRKPQFRAFRILRLLYRIRKDPEQIVHFLLRVSVDYRVVDFEQAVHQLPVESLLMRLYVIEADLLQNIYGLAQTDDPRINPPVTRAGRLSLRPRIQAGNPAPCFFQT